MSNKKLIIEERSRDIGNFMVGRLLPFRRKRMIGPFVFVDHMGPTVIRPDTPMSVDQHPHIGIATLTYLLDGEIMHEDSIGSQQRIRPNEVNLMIAGKGITHTERKPKELSEKTYTIEGYQIWIALPKAMEEMTPEFHHLSTGEIPNWEANGLAFKLLAGTAFGKQSTLPLWSDLFFIEIKAKEEQTVDFGRMLQGEIGILVNSGAIITSEERIEQGNLLVSKQENTCQLTIVKGSRIFILGGQPFAEKRFIDWNFVSSDLEKINQAKEDWANKRFPRIHNDKSYIPYPSFIR